MPPRNPSPELEPTRSTTRLQSSTSQPADAGHERFRQLVTNHRSFVSQLLRHAGLQHCDADDLAQRTFWTAYRKMSQIRPEQERAFLRRVALREASHLRRSWSRRREVCDPDVCEATPESTRQDELVRRRRALTSVRRALDSMDATLRQVVVLFEIEGRTSAETAQLLGIPQGTAKTRLRRAREILARRCADAS